MYKKNNKQDKNNKKNYSKKYDNKNSRNKRNKSDKPDLSKYTDIRYKYSGPSVINFDMFGNVCVNEKAILATFRLYNNGDENKKIAEMYYKSDELINNTRKILEKTLFKSIRKIKKKDIHPGRNNHSAKTEIALPVLNKYGKDIYKSKCKIKLNIRYTINHYDNDYYCLRVLMPDIFRLVKILSFQKQLRYLDSSCTEDDEREYFFSLFNHKLSSFIYELENSSGEICYSTGFFINYKQPNRLITNSLIRISKYIPDNSALEDELTDLYYLIENSFEFTTVKDFKASKSQ